MIELGILKNFDGGTYKAGVQLAGSLTTYFDDISVAKNIPSSALVIGNYVILAIPGGNPRDACVIATWPQGSPGGGAFLDLSDTPGSYSGQAGKYTRVNAAGNALEFEAHAGLTTGVHGAGSNKLAHTGLFVPIAGEILRLYRFSASSPFTAKINGAPSSTSVIYDTDTNEGSLKGLYSGAGYWGRIVLHNLTRGNSRKIVGVSTGTNTIGTEESTDDWADDDDITTQSQTNAEAGYFDVDVSAQIPASASYMGLLAAFYDLEGIADNPSRTLFYHPYEAYDIGKRFWINASLANEATTAWWIVPVISQRITLFFRQASGDMLFVSAGKGYM